MARKNISAHRDAQFALFVERMKDQLDGETKSEFEQIVRRLIRVVDRDAPDAPPDEGGDDPQGLDKFTPSEANEAAHMPPSAATSSDLPAPPDFDAIEVAARETVASRANLMALIGQLVFSSSNNESLLIYILMILLQTDEASAAIVFSTLNTTRARLDLVSRLAKIKVNDRETRSALRARSAHQGFQRHQSGPQRVPARDVHGGRPWGHHAHPDHATRHEERQDQLWPAARNRPEAT
jgi:hypothetical protein